MIEIRHPRCRSRRHDRRLGVGAVAAAVAFTAPRPQQGSILATAALLFVVAMEAVVIAALVYVLLRWRRSLELLRERERENVLLTDTVAVVAYAALPDAHTTILFATPRIETLTGHPPEAFLERPGLWRHLVYEEDREDVQSAIQAHRAAKEPFDMEYRIVRRDGEIRWMRDVAVPVIDDEGEIDHVYGFLEDVTERKETEMALREREAMLAKAEELAGIGSYVWDLRDDTLVWSENMRAIAGLSKGYQRETLDDVVAEFIHPEDREHLEQELAAMLEAETTWPVEFRFVRPDGQIRTLLSDSVFIRDDDDHPIKLLGLPYDLTEQRSVQQALAESEHFAQAIVDTTPNALYIYDLEKERHTWVNKAGREIYGTPSDEPGKPPWTERVHSADWPRITERFECLKAAPDGAWCDVEYRVRTADGTWEWFHDRASVFSRNAEGKIRELIGAAVPVTSQKQAEAAVAEMRDFYEQVLHRLHEGVWVADADQVVTYANPAAKAMSGDGGVALVGSYIPSDAPREALREWWPYYEQALETLEPTYYEVTVRSEGEFHPDMAGWLMPIVDQGRFNGIICTMQDVTARRRAEMALRHSEERFNRFMHYLPAAVSICDADNRLVYANEKLADLTRMPLSRLLGSHLGDVMPEDLTADPTDGHRLVLEEGRMLETEHRYWASDGVRDWMTIRFPIYQGSEPPLIGTLSFDITERKQMEAQLRDALQGKTVLLQEIHHRVKNNLAVVVSLLGLQSLIVEDPAAQAALEESQRRIHAMARVHEHLYRSSDIARVDMGDYIEALGHDLQVSLGLTDVELQVEADAMKFKLDTAIPCALILNELVTNAFKHGFGSAGSEDGRGVSPPADEPRLRIGLAAINGTATMSIRNNGRPLPDDFDIMTSESLGLSLVRLLVQQLGGTISFDCRAGTTFEVAFPLPGAR